MAKTETNFSCGTNAERPEQDGLILPAGVDRAFHKFFTFFVSSNFLHAERHEFSSYLLILRYRSSF